jgi:hypothetical protein
VRKKLFGWFGGPGLDAIGQFFTMLGFAPGRRHALMAGLAETGGSSSGAWITYTGWGSTRLGCDACGSRDRAH